MAVAELPQGCDRTCWITNHCTLNARMHAGATLPREEADYTLLEVLN